MDKKDRYNAIDLFAGCGGLSEGMHKAGFNIKVGIEKDNDAAITYKANHKHSTILVDDIRNIQPATIKKLLSGQVLHLLAGCPPCQGFSSVRRLNRNRSVRDDRNSLVLEYLRFVKELQPLTVMMENVPGLIDYHIFKQVVRELKKMKYEIKTKIINVKNYGVPQSRKRLIMLGSLLGDIDIAPGNCETVTVREAIGNMESTDVTADPIHKIKAKHSPHILEMIKLIPKNGGSRKDLPGKYILECHKKDKVGFNDIYGRLRWDDQAVTITGGCLNPSKGRFLHPEEDRVITAREAALLQTFPRNYKFPISIRKTSLALLIGNALPPKFSYIQSKNIKEHLDKYLG